MVVALSPATLVVSAALAMFIIRVGQVLIVAIELAIELIKLAVHSVTFTVQSVPLAVKLGALFVGDTCYFMVVAVVAALPLINIPVALIQLAHLCVKLPVHIFPLTVKRFALPLYMLSWRVVTVPIMLNAAAGQTVLEITVRISLRRQRGAAREQIFYNPTAHSVSLTW